MAFVLDPDTYPAVRGAIGLEANEVSVPDSLLDLEVYKGEAERFIMRNLTEAQYTDAQYADEAKYAAILYLASLVTPTMRVVISERIAGGNLTYANINLQAVADRLLEQALARLAEITTALPVGSPVTDIPVVFTLGRRRRPSEFGE